MHIPTKFHMMVFFLFPKKPSTFLLKIQVFQPAESATSQVEQPKHSALSSQVSCGSRWDFWEPSSSSSAGLTSIDMGHFNYFNPRLAQRIGENGGGVISCYIPKPAGLYVLMVNMMIKIKSGARGPSSRFALTISPFISQP